jgi:hypothetical protein
MRITLALVILLAVTHCNMLRSSGKAQFSASEKPGMGRLSLTGPSGWQCIEFEKTRTNASSTELSVSGIGRGKCPLFGAYVTDSTEFPNQGNAIEVPADQPTRIYQNAKKDFEIYVLVTKDGSVFEKIKKGDAKKLP